MQNKKKDMEEACSGKEEKKEQKQKRNSGATILVERKLSRSTSPGITANQEVDIIRYKKKKNIYGDWTVTPVDVKEESALDDHSTSSRRLGRDGRDGTSRSDPIPQAESIQLQKTELSRVIEQAKQQCQTIIWFNMPYSTLSMSWELLKKNGFKMSYDTGESIMFSASNGALVSKKPVYGTHAVKVVAVLLRKKESVLQFAIVRERYTTLSTTSGEQKTDWKLPSGGVNECETFESAVVREVHEELGLKSRFDRQIGVINRSTTQRGRNEIVIFCKLFLSEPSVNSDVIETIEHDEILEAKWVNVDRLSELSRSNPLLRSSYANAVRYAAKTMSFEITRPLSEGRKEASDPIRLPFASSSTGS